MTISWYDIKPERIYIRDIELRTQLQVENDEQRDARRAAYPNW